MTAEVQVFIEAEKQADRNVVKACELLEVSRSAFYDRLNHVRSAREISDAELTEKIKTIHTVSAGTYGAPRVFDELRQAGWHVGKKRVARLMVLVPRRKNDFGERSSSAADFFDDVVSFGVPDEGFGVVVPVLDPQLDGVD